MIAGVATETMVESTRIMKNPRQSAKSAGQGRTSSGSVARSGVGRRELGVLGHDESQHPATDNPSRRRVFSRVQAAPGENGLPEAAERARRWLRCGCSSSTTRSGWPPRCGSGCEAEGFAVDVAHDGTDGLWMARENTYDAIVLDLMLPGINGYKVCETLRAEEDWTPILMLTAKDGEWDQVEGLDTGADDYLTKPFSFPVLVARLRAVVRRARRERPTRLEVGDLRLDPAARRVWRGDVEVELTAREFSLLAFLMRHPGDVAVQAADHRGRLGRRLRGRPQHRRGLRRSPAQQARPPVRPRRDPDGARRRLPAGERRWLSGAVGPRLGPRRTTAGRGARRRRSPCAVGASRWSLLVRHSLADGLETTRRGAGLRRWPSRSSRRAARWPPGCRGRRRRAASDDLEDAGLAGHGRRRHRRTRLPAARRARCRPPTRTSVGWPAPTPPTSSSPRTRASTSCPWRSRSRTSTSRPPPCCRRCWSGCPCCCSWSARRRGWWSRGRWLRSSGSGGRSSGSPAPGWTGGCRSPGRATRSTGWR